MAAVENAQQLTAGGAGAATLPRLTSLGVGAMLCEAPRPLDIRWQRRLWALAAHARTWPFVSEAVLGMNNLLLVYDPLADGADGLADAVLKLWPDCDASDQVGKFVEVPVVYGGEAGPDLDELARHAKISVREFVRRHTEPEYTVFFVGGYPGQPHMAGLHPSLIVPRRIEPRMRVPAGTVAIGGEQASIYPSTQPGGLQMIGSTDVVVFDIDREPPSLLAPGDKVRFSALRIDT